MDFVDATLIRLADPATRAAVFAQPVLEQIARTAYDADALALQGPFDALFDSFELGVSTSSVVHVEGTLRDSSGGAAPKEVRLEVSGLGSAVPGRVDALWRGSVVARTVPLDGRIATVRAEVAADDIDARIIAADGALPTDRETLEAARRAQFAALLKQQLAQPELLEDAAIDRWLATTGAGSFSALVERNRGTMVPAVLKVGFTPPSGAAAAPRSLPIIAALLIRDAPIRIAELLVESKNVRDQLSDRGFEVPRETGLPARKPLMVVWVVPATLFDDEGWPGSGATPAAKRADRSERAAQWLASEGIAIAGVEA